MAVADNSCFLFAAGGTGGHLFPAIAIADEIRKIEPDARIVFAGTKDRIEASVVPQRGYEFAPIWISGFHRRMTISNLLFPVKAVVAFMQSILLLLREKPDAVAGTGGYVCGPVLFAASLMNIPTLVHESNSYPGATTRMLASRVTKLYIAFDATRRWLGKNGKRAELIGTPTRDELVAAKRDDGRTMFALSQEKKVLFVFGGSLGAESLNRVVARNLPELRAAGIEVLWQTGRHQSRRYDDLSSDGVTVRQFIDDMPHAYAAADLVVCRAGATTLAELTRLGKPAILVPYPHAAADHQTVNAQTMADAGAALMITNRDFPVQGIEAVRRLIGDDAELKTMGIKSLSLGRPAAGKEIARNMCRMAHGN
jgi:UDP-N-acetylglucosamine--N-acetylmuramyl-(pentapeptide) pyrophosphoryl-undecaprenol N-acetylglucosamine transferase